MGRQWAIAIGINNYSAFQALSYAQNDAEALCRELLSSGRVSPANCLLLTTASALHLGQSTFPLQTTILQWFQWLVDEALQPDDELWVFFSGYGIHTEDNDYWMPVDGDPKQAKETGIELRSLYQLLKESACDRILMLLDMNHNEGTLAIPVGIQTAKLAKEFGIATVQSCEPQKGQFSRKASGIRQGFFTAALLDALQGDRLTDLPSLNTLLTQRMEEFSDHYWRPVQTPLSVGEYTFQPAPETTGQRETAGVSVAQEDTAVTPLDINYVPTSGDGSYGQDFGEGWNWTDSDVPALNETPSGITAPGATTTGTTAGSNGSNPVNGPMNGNGNGNGNGNTSPVPGTTAGAAGAAGAAGLATVTAIEDSGEDPYALAWQEEHLSPQPTTAAENPAPVTDPDSLNGNSSTDYEASQDYQAGKAGASSWHWADLIVAPEQPGSTGTGFYPEPGPQGQLGNSSGEVDAADPATGGAETPLSFPETDPTVTTIPPNWSSPEISNPETANPETANPGTANPGISNSGISNSGTSNPAFEAELLPETGLNSGTNSGTHSGTVQTIDVEPATSRPLIMPPASGTGQGNALDNDFDNELANDDDGGLPIIALDPLEGEEDGSSTAIATNPKGKLPWWLNLKLLGAAGLVLLTALGLLNLFNRGQEGDQPGGNASKTNAEANASPNGNAQGDASGQDPQGTAQSFNTGGVSDSGRAIAAPETNAPETNAPETNSPESNAAGLGSDERSGNRNENDAAASSTPEDLAAQGDVDTPSDTEAAASGNPVSANDNDSNGSDSNGSDSNGSDTSVNSPGQQRLAAASQLIRPGQASSYNQAMTQARQIPSSDPNYQKARAEMDLWSQSIMDLAEERSGNGDYLGAIAAARLVPSDLRAYPEAQESIAQWQAPSQLQHAKALLRPGSASSYNQAIAIARGIPDGIAVSEEANRLRDAWSREILNIAQARAQKGQWGLAIAAAKLVPSDMANYPKAQEVMSQWQERLN